MNMQITARDVRTYAEQIANRKEVMARLYGHTKITNIIANPPPTPLPAPVEIKKAVMVMPSDEELERRFSGRVVEMYMYMRCVEMGVRYSAIVGPDRTPALTPHRKQLIIEVRDNFDLSHEKIGVLFSRTAGTIGQLLNGKVRAPRDRSIKSKKDGK